MNLDRDMSSSSSSSCPDPVGILRIGTSSSIMSGHIMKVQFPPVLGLSASPQMSSRHLLETAFLRNL